MLLDRSFTARPPFVGRTVLDVLFAHRNQRAPSLTQLAMVGIDLANVVERLLAKSPNERFGSAEEVADALKLCEKSGTWSEADARYWWSAIVPTTTESARDTTVDPLEATQDLRL